MVPTHRDTWVKGRYQRGSLWYKNTPKEPNRGSNPDLSNQNPELIGPSPTFVQLALEYLIVLSKKKTIEVYMFIYYKIRVLDKKCSCERVV